VVLAALWWCFGALRGQVADGTFAEACPQCRPPGRARRPPYSSTRPEDGFRTT